MLQKCTMLKVLSVFFKDPSKRFSLKEISLLLKIAHTSVKKELNNLLKEKLIKKEIEIKGKRKYPFYYANLNSHFTENKKIYNLYLIINSGLVQHLKNLVTPNSIILFGSFSRGEDLKESDIDLFIESKIKEIDLKKFEKKLNKKINLHFNPDINKLKKTFLNNLINGIVLYGFIELNEK